MRNRNVRETIVDRGPGETANVQLQSATLILAIGRRRRRWTWEEPVCILQLESFCGNW